MFVVSPGEAGCGLFLLSFMHCRTTTVVTARVHHVLICADMTRYVLVQVNLDSCEDPDWYVPPCLITIPACVFHLSGSYTQKRISAHSTFGIKSCEWHQSSNKMSFKVAVFVCGFTGHTLNRTFVLLLLLLTLVEESVGSSPLLQAKSCCQEKQLVQFPVVMTAVVSCVYASMCVCVCVFSGT